MSENVDYGPTRHGLFLQAVLILVFNVVQALVVFVILGIWVVARVGFYESRQFVEDL